MLKQEVLVPTGHHSQEPSPYYVLVCSNVPRKLPFSRNIKLSLEQTTGPSSPPGPGKALQLASDAVVRMHSNLLINGALTLTAGGPFLKFFKGPPQQAADWMESMDFSLKKPGSCEVGWEGDVTPRITRMTSW